MTDSLLTSSEVNDSEAINVEQIDDGDYKEEESEIEVEDVSMDLLNNQEAEEKEFFEIDSILGHRHEGNNRIRINIKWSDGSNTWERLFRVRVDAPQALAEYAMEHNLLDQRGFTWYRTYLESAKANAAINSKVNFSISTIRQSKRILK